MDRSRVAGGALQTASTAPHARTVFGNRALTLTEWIRNVNGDFGPIPGGRVQASSVSANAYRKLAREQTAFESLVGVADLNPAALAIDSTPAEQVGLQYISGNFFQGLGVAPIAGRPFRGRDRRGAAVRLGHGEASRDDALRSRTTGSANRRIVFDCVACRRSARRLDSGVSSGAHRSDECLARGIEASPTRSKACLRG
jgi:hypothetical protein